MSAGLSGARRGVQPVGGGGAEHQQTYPRDHGGPPTPSAPPWGGWAAQRALAAAPNGCPRARRNAVLQRTDEATAASNGLRPAANASSSGPASRRSLVCASTSPPLATLWSPHDSGARGPEGGWSLHAKLQKKKDLAPPVGQVGGPDVGIEQPPTLSSCLKTQGTKKREPKIATRPHRHCSARLHRHT